MFNLTHLAKSIKSRIGGEKSVKTNKMADLPLPQISQMREKKMVSTAGNFSSRPSPDGSGSQKFEDMEVAVLSLEDS